MEGAETLSYLIQEDPELQKITSICDHSMKALAEYLSYTDIQQLDSRQAQKKVQFWFQISYIAPTTEKGTVLVSHQLHFTRHRTIYSFGFMSATLHQAQNSVQFGFHVSTQIPSSLTCVRHRKRYSFGVTSATQTSSSLTPNRHKKGVSSDQPLRDTVA